MEMPEHEIMYVDGRPELLMIEGRCLSRFDLLAEAIKGENKKTSFKILQLASILFHWQDDTTFNSLYGAAAMQICFNNNKNENDLHHLFNQNIKKIFGEDAEMINKQSDGRNLPDSWVSLGGSEIPVEMKMGKFNSKAMKQLKRYMDNYGCKAGIAVGSELTTPIPSNVKFISNEQLGWNE
jgi:hypothetical protein